MRIHWNRFLQGAGIGLFILGSAFLLSGCTAPEISDSTQEQQIKKEYQDPSFPEPTNYVVDAADLLSPATEVKLENDIKALGDKAEISVVTVPSIAPLSIEEYSIKLAEKWKVGNKVTDNGVIIIIALKERKVRIEVGRGNEAFITDAQAGRILDNVMVPYLRQGKWDEAVLAGFDAVKKELN